MSENKKSSMDLRDIIGDDGSVQIGDTEFQRVDPPKIPNDNQRIIVNPDSIDNRFEEMSRRETKLKIGQHQYTIIPIGRDKTPFDIVDVNGENVFGGPFEELVFSFEDEGYPFIAAKRVNNLNFYVFSEDGDHDWYQPTYKTMVGVVDIKGDKVLKIASFSGDTDIGFYEKHGKKPLFGGHHYSTGPIVEYQGNTVLLARKNHLPNSDGFLYKIYNLEGKVIEKFGEPNKVMRDLVHFYNHYFLIGMDHQRFRNVWFFYDEEGNKLPIFGRYHRLIYSFETDKPQNKFEGYNHLDGFVFVHGHPVLIADKPKKEGWFLYDIHNHELFGGGFKRIRQVKEVETMPLLEGISNSGLEGFFSIDGFYSQDEDDLVYGRYGAWQKIDTAFIDFREWLIKGTSLGHVQIDNVKLASDAYLFERANKSLGMSPSDLLDRLVPILKSSDSVNRFSHFIEIFDAYLDHEEDFLDKIDNLVQIIPGSVDRREQFITSLKANLKLPVSQRNSLEQMLDCAKLGTDQYDILNVLGEGNHAETYLAFSKNLKAYRALKAIKPGDVSNEEVEIMALLEGAEIKNVVKIYYADNLIKDAVGRQRYCIVMEYVDGKTLDEIMREKPDEKTVIDIGCQTFQGVYGLRQNGITHYDLHMKNIKRNSQGVIKILDFGSSSDEKRYYHGNKEFKAPDYLQGDSYSNPDLISLGLMIYKLYKGEHLVLSRTEDMGTKTFKERAAHMINKMYHNFELRKEYWQKIENLPDRIGVLVAACLEHYDDIDYVKSVFEIASPDLKYKLMTEDEKIKKIKELEGKDGS
ncbi:MAG: protein kinase [Nanoarchaeota archaeon]|nr:protein kinase [Nanoarchaeota archaeon]